MANLMITKGMLSMVNPSYLRNIVHDTIGRPATRTGTPNGVEEIDPDPYRALDQL